MDADLCARARWADNWERIIGPQESSGNHNGKCHDLHAERRNSSESDYVLEYALAVSPDRRLIASCRYMPISNGSNCDGHVILIITGAGTNRVVASAESCFENATGAFSGFVAHAGTLGYYLMTNREAIASESDDAYYRKYIVALLESGKTIEYKNMTCSVISAAPTGERLALVRYLSNQVQIEVRNAGLDSTCWSVEWTIESDVLPAISWSEDARLIGIISDCKSAIRMRLFDLASGRLLLDRATPKKDDEWLGPVLISRRGAVQEPVRALGVAVY
ncbi:MAG TPA: hypothetical protein VMV81_02110 [Phycisphaerae bacterium]|nr:hypothetical protein [Phycisphaerae bacterium]